jgi:hypothetical protein
VFQPTYTDKGILRTSSTWWMKLPDGTKEKCVGATSEREARVCLQKRMGQVAMGTAPKAGEKHLCYGELREVTLLDMQVNKLKSLERLSKGDGFSVGRLSRVLLATGPISPVVYGADVESDRCQHDFVPQLT